MTRVAVDLHRLAEFVDHLERFQAMLRRAQDETDGRVRELHTTWSGTAAQAQAAAHAQWSAGSHEVRQALAELRVIAGTAHGNYAAAVEANRRLWAVS